MTNEEILREFNKRFPELKIRNGWNAVADMERFICNAMDEARKDEAISFNKFVGCRYIRLCEHRYIGVIDSIYQSRPAEYTTEQLYELFKQQK